jgi:hypothetical protein
MISFKEWRLKNEMVGTGAIYNGEKATDYSVGKGDLPANKRDYNWWGAPETAGKTQKQAHDHMEKDVEKPKHHKKKKHKLKLALNFGGEPTQVED